jgi:hypothetical protein
MREHIRSLLSFLESIWYGWVDQLSVLSLLFWTKEVQKADNLLPDWLPSDLAHGLNILEGRLKTRQPAQDQLFRDIVDPCMFPLVSNISRNIREKRVKIESSGEGGYEASSVLIREVSVVTLRDSRRERQDCEVWVIPQLHSPRERALSCYYSVNPRGCSIIRSNTHEPSYSC